MIAEPPFTAQAREYLACCAAAPRLDSRYHPTEDGAVKLIWHRGADEADQIRHAFRRVAPALQSPGPQGQRRAANSANRLGDDPDALPQP